MKPDDFNPQTLATDLEQLIGTTFENFNKKKQFRELEQFAHFLIELGYKFNLIRELKQVKVIPFKKFVYRQSLSNALSPSDGNILPSSDPLQQLNTLMAKAASEGNYELAAAYRDKVDEAKSNNPLQKVNASMDLEILTIDHTQKTLKIHVAIEHSMVHIYLITRQEWFVDKVHDCITVSPKSFFAWLKSVVGK